MNDPEIAKTIEQMQREAGKLRERFQAEREELIRREAEAEALRAREARAREAKQKVDSIAKAIITLGEMVEAVATIEDAIGDEEHLLGAMESIIKRHRDRLYDEMIGATADVEEAEKEENE